MTAILTDPLEISLEGDELKRRSAHGSLAMAVSQAVRLGILFVGQIICARLLFPADFGILAMAYPVAGFISLFNEIGLGQVIVQRQRLVVERVSSLFWISIAVGCILALVVACVAPLAAWMYQEPKIAAVTATLGLFIPIGAAGGVADAILTRQMQFTIIARNELAAAFGGIATTILFAWLGLGYWSLVWGQAATVILSGALNWLACRWRPSFPRVVAGLGADLKFGSNLTLVGLAIHLTTSADNMIIGAVNGKTTVGLYDRAYRLVVQPVGQLLHPVERVIVPLLSRLVLQDNDYRSTYLFFLRASLLAATPLMVICIAAPDEIIEVILGRRWIEAAPIFLWICIGGLASAIHNSAIWLYISQNKLDKLRNFTFLTCAINLTSFVIGYRWGILVATACGSLSFALVSTPLMLYGATRTGPVDMQQVSQSIIPFALTSFIVFGIHLSLPNVTSIGIIISRIVIITGLSFIALALFVPNVRLILKAGIGYAKDFFFDLTK